MTSLKNLFKQRLQYKIITPFLFLTLLAVAVNFLVIFINFTSSHQLQFDNDLAQAMRTTNDQLINQERVNLSLLSEIVFAGENKEAKAPPVAEALAAGDQDGLTKALKPYFIHGSKKSSAELDRLIAFNRQGYTVFDFENNTFSSGGQPSPTNFSSSAYITHSVLDLSQQWFVRELFNKADNKPAGTKETFEDKLSALVRQPGPKGTDTYYFYTIAPVRKDETVVGGIVVALRLEHLLKRIQLRPDIVVTVYDPFEGKALESTLVPPSGLSALDIGPSRLEQLQRISPEDQKAKKQALFDTRRKGELAIEDRSYQFAYTPFVVNNSKRLGIISVGLVHNTVEGSWTKVRSPVIFLVVVMVLAIVCMGFLVAQKITAPLRDLVNTTKAVMEGNFWQRSQVQSEDEIGLLARSFNRMTEYLVELFRRISKESSERLAIFESMADGIVICDEFGNLRNINPAGRKIFGWAETSPLPPTFSDLPLVPLEGQAFGFADQASPNLYSVGEYIVRISQSPIISRDQGHEVHIGEVYVLQDLTTEVQVDRAKTSFIATISHELRTPLTTLRGNADMLLHGLAGPLKDEQRAMVETIGQQTTNMTNLITNMIVIAGLDAGSLTIVTTPLPLKRSLEETAWPLRKAISAKGLTLNFELPDEMPLVLADRIQLRTIMQQLLTNARVYTDQGSITVRAKPEQGFVRIDVIDTGCGIEPELIPKIFERFVRGEGSNDRPDRGIGLGLTIVKQLVERQGGQVWVISNPGQGSTFSFTLRCEEDEKQDPEQTNQIASAA